MKTKVKFLCIAAGFICLIGIAASVFAEDTVCGTLGYYFESDSQPHYGGVCECNGVPAISQKTECNPLLGGGSCRIIECTKAACCEEAQ